MQTDVSGSRWDDVRGTLEQALLELPDRGFVTLGEPIPAAVRLGGLRGALGARSTPPHRFVQVLRLDGVLCGECVGAESFGGPYPIDAATDARLRELGWNAPGDAGWEPGGAPAYQRQEPAGARAGAADLAALAVRTLALLGLSATGPLALTTGP